MLTGRPLLGHQVTRTHVCGFGFVCFALSFPGVGGQEEDNIAYFFLKCDITF